MHVDVLQAINTQINSEFQAWYQYLAMAAFCEREKFTGAARWLKMQSVEEYHHGMKLFDFVLARNGAVELRAIEQPTIEFDTFGDVFERVLEQEERVTGQINDLYELAFRSKAFAEMTELQWFLTEQVEEEKSSAQVLESVRRVGDNQAALVMLDRDESALHAVQLSIEGRALLDRPDLVVADIRDRGRLREIFTTWQPEVVFHAAALKHLPLLELHPDEAVKTN